MNRRSSTRRNSRVEVVYVEPEFERARHEASLPPAVVARARTELEEAQKAFDAATGAVQSLEESKSRSQDSRRRKVAKARLVGSELRLTKARKELKLAERRLAEWSCEARSESGYHPAADRGPNSVTKQRSEPDLEENFITTSLATACEVRGVNLTLPQLRRFYHEFVSSRMFEVPKIEWGLAFRDALADNATFKIAFVPPDWLSFSEAWQDVLKEAWTLAENGTRIVILFLDYVDRTVSSDWFRVLLEHSEGKPASPSGSIWPTRLRVMYSLADDQFSQPLNLDLKSSPFQRDEQGGLPPPGAGRQDARAARQAGVSSSGSKSHAQTSGPKQSTTRRQGLWLAHCREQRTAGLSRSAQSSRLSASHAALLNTLVKKWAAVDTSTSPATKHARSEELQAFEAAAEMAGFVPSEVYQEFKDFVKEWGDLFAGF